MQECRLLSLHLLRREGAEARGQGLGAWSGPAGKLQGFGHVQFATEDCVQRALQLHGSMLKASPGPRT